MGRSSDGPWPRAAPGDDVMGGLNCPVDTLRTMTGQFEDSLVRLSI